MVAPRRSCQLTRCRRSAGPPSPQSPFPIPAVCLSGVFVSRPISRVVRVSPISSYLNACKNACYFTWSKFPFLATLQLGVGAHSHLGHLFSSQYNKIVDITAILTIKGGMRGPKAKKLLNLVRPSAGLAPPVKQSLRTRSSMSLHPDLDP